VLSPKFYALLQTGEKRAEAARGRAHSFHFEVPSLASSNGAARGCGCSTMSLHAVRTARATTHGWCRLGAALLFAVGSIKPESLKRDFGVLVALTGIALLAGPLVNRLDSR